MINPVHAYYQICLLSELYYETADITEIIFNKLIDELTRHFIGLEFDNFYIKNVYDDGDCYVSYYDEREDNWVKLKDIMEIK